MRSERWALLRPAGFRPTEAEQVPDRPEIDLPDGFSVHDDDARGRRVKAFATLAGSCPDFPDIEPNRASNLRRDRE